MCKLSLYMDKKKNIIFQSICLLQVKRFKENFARVLLKYFVK